MSLSSSSVSAGRTPASCPQLQRPAAALVDQTADRASIGAERVLEHVIDQVDRPPRAQVVAHHRPLLVVAVVAARVGAGGAQPRRCV